VTARRAVLLLLAALAARPAAAQSRAAAGAAADGSAVLRAGPALGPALAPAPLRTAALGALNAPSLSLAPSAAPLPTAAPFAAALAAPAPLPAAAAPAPAPAAGPARRAPEGALFSPARERSRVPAAFAARALEAPRPASAAAPEATLDALFDGRATARPLAASDGPERAAADPSAPAKPSSRLRRSLRRAAVAVPVVVAAAAAGLAAPHAALLGAHGLGQIAYWIANPFAFLFTIPQVHRMLARRSADISAGMISIGLASTAIATLNFAFDSKDLMMYRNLAQFLGFAAMLLLQWRFARAPGGAPPSKRRALAEAGAVVLGLGAAMLAAGPALMALVPGLALMGSLLVPLQVVSGFGFTYLMYAQLTRMRRAHSSGDSSPGMMWAYLGTKAIWVWSLATMISLATAPAWLTLPAAAGLAAVCWLAGDAALSRLLRSRWTFLPGTLSLRGRTLTRERMSDMAAFAAMSALILVLSGAGYLAFVGALGVPAADASRFAMYLLYMVQSLVACLATLRTLRLRKEFERERAAVRP
jgi:hypothetical protein